MKKYCKNERHTDNLLSTFIQGFLSFIILALFVTIVCAISNLGMIKLAPKLYLIKQFSESGCKK